MVCVQEAIASAKSLEEVKQLEALLKSGQLPVGVQGNQAQGGLGYRVQNGQLVEEDMEN